jgi:hypothetical protein
MTKRISLREPKHPECDVPVVCIWEGQTTTLKEKVIVWRDEPWNPLKTIYIGHRDE